MYGDLSVNNCPSKQTQIYQSVILRHDSTGAVFLSGGGFGGRIVVATMVVGGVLSTGVSAAQHCCPAGAIGYHNYWHACPEILKMTLFSDFSRAKIDPYLWELLVKMSPFFKNSEHGKFT